MFLPCFYLLNETDKRLNVSQHGSILISMPLCIILPSDSDHTSQLADEPPSVSSADVLHTSKDQEDDGARRAEQLPHKDSAESSFSLVQLQSDGCEEGDFNALWVQQRHASRHGFNFFFCWTMTQTYRMCRLSLCKPTWSHSHFLFLSFHSS